MNSCQKIALVTGADRGLGFSIVRGLLEEGFCVYAGRVLPDYRLLDELQKKYPALRPIRLDVSEIGDIQKSAEQIARECGRLDLLVSNAALMGGNSPATLGGPDPIDFEALERSFRINSLAAPLLTDALLPLLERGSMKRLFFVSSEISSLRLMHRTGDMRYAMSKTALNLGVRMLFNSLRPLGYTFRLYQPGWMKRVLPDGSRAEGALIDPDESAAEALRQMLSDRLDEDRLALTDYLGHELSF